jgi:hypothetical protein
VRVAGPSTGWRRMTSKRTFLHRRRGEPITWEMTALYSRGLQLKAMGADDVDADGPEADEFRSIDKRLCWSLLRRPPHQVSIFENLDDPPPPYMQARNSAAHPDFSGWYTGRELQRRFHRLLLGQRGHQRGQIDAPWPGRECP